MPGSAASPGIAGWTTAGNIGAGGEEPPEGYASGAEETYFRREEARAALAGLERLPEPYGEVLRLRALGGLSFRDIGAAYGKTETWARVTCFRARQRLKEEME